MSDQEIDLLTGLALLTGDAGSAIEMMEGIGQRDLVNGPITRLPFEGMKDARPLLERLGFQLEVNPMIDKVFCRVIAPEGWTLQAHKTSSYYSNLVDPAGRVRAEIFYKAAIYDRRADISMVRRYFNAGHTTGKTWHIKMMDRATNAVLEVSDDFPAGEYQAYQDHLDKMETRLRDRFPDFENVEAYWD